MIIQVRGTSGSGKSTIVKAIRDHGKYEARYIEGRKQPLYYVSTTQPKIVILGHYEIPCGGCDTIGSARAVYDLIQKVLKTEQPTHVLCEGLLLSEDSKWTKLLAEFIPDLKVVYLHVDIEDCIKRIKRRRRDNGNLKPFDETNTRNRIKPIERSKEKLKEYGVNCYILTPDQALLNVRKWLN